MVLRIHSLLTSKLALFVSRNGRLVLIHIQEWFGHQQWHLNRYLCNVRPVLAADDTGLQLFCVSAMLGSSKAGKP